MRQSSSDFSDSYRRMFSQGSICLFFCNGEYD
uniref:Uncharacterized protein n=1 Tax=Siphoviridae sp. ctr8v12 TaxID=2825685 RepID=A0A8S5QFV2_9CAUD|nr:MAG TPA: hypothetical protein [Siphoviridae sp. ctr8v12]